MFKRSICVKCTKTLISATLLMCLPLLTCSVYGQSSSKVKEVFGDNTITLPVEYQFDKSVTMELTTWDSDGSEEGATSVYLMRYHKNQNHIGMEPVEMSGMDQVMDADVVIDFDRMHMITFMAGDESSMALVSDISDKQVVAHGSTDSRDVKFKKTGKEKELFGFYCFEYKVTGADLTGTVWSAPELDLNLNKSFQALGLQFEMGDDGQGQDPNGFIVEFDLTNKKTGVRSKMKVINVDLNDNFSLNTSGYVVTRMGSSQK